MVASGSGSVSVMGGTSRVSSALVCSPSSTLHGSFLRVRPCMKRRSSSFTRSPTASRAAGVHGGSSRLSGLAAVPRVSHVRTSVSRAASEMALTLVNSSRTSSTSRSAQVKDALRTVNRVFIERNERVSPPLELGSARMVSSLIQRSSAVALGWSLTEKAGL